VSKQKLYEIVKQKGDVDGH